jgi:hypothetical protein
LLFGKYSAVLMQETLFNALLLPRHARAAGTIFRYSFYGQATDKVHFLL